MQIDAKDARILNLVQLNSRLTAEEIGYEVGLSHTGVTRRLQRLRKAAVIVAEVAIVAPETVGLPVRVNVSCSIERDRPDTHDRFMDALRADPMVVNADMVIGRADFTFTVVAPDMAAFSALLQRYADAFPTLTSLTSLAVLQAVKRGSAVPVQPTRAGR